MKKTAPALLWVASACASAAPEPQQPPAQPAQDPAVEVADVPPPGAPHEEAGRDTPRPTPQAPATAALSFTTAQANQGRDVFRASCTACHSSSEFSDRTFKFKWRRRTAGDLYNHMYSTMPEDAPGSLAPSEYAALVAYVLRLNGVDPGEGELPADEAALEALSLAPIANQPDRVNYPDRASHPDHASQPDRASHSGRRSAPGDQPVEGNP